ncbi:Iron-regulated protein FrpC [Nymphon striatum]|nr:Iron-regulated protein FrpC [Nymphon striatum]
MTPLLSPDGFGADTITGGETSEIAGDTLDLSGTTTGLTVDLTDLDPEAGTFSDGTDTASFTEIENYHLGNGSSGADVINDAYVLDPEGDRVDAGDNIDGSGNDNDTIQAGDGADTIDSGAGDDTVFAGSGDDVIFLDGGIDNDSIVGGETGEIGTGDRIEMGAITDDLTIDMSGPEAGTITDGVNTTSFEEIEQLTLGAGADSLTGSTGAEYVFGGTGDDTILGGGGDDTIFSGLDDDSVEGGAGDDSIAGSTGSDTIDGGAGNDNIDVGGADSVVDTVVLQDGSGDDVVSNFQGPIANPDGTFTGVDQFDVTALNDNLGNPVNTNDVVVSDDGTGNAVLTFPNGESVILNGIAPADVTDPLALNAMGIPLGTDGIVSGTAAGELIDAGYVGDPDGDLVDANDAQFAGQTGDQDIIQAGGGNDTVIAGADNDSVLGEAGDDSLFGGDGEDTLDGGAGDDTLVGGASHDSLIGGTGNDSLLGGQSNDTLEGGAGNDTLSGGTAFDSLDGGADADLIIVEDGYGGDTIAGGETVTTGVDQDTIEAGSLTGDTTVIYSGDEAGDMATGSNTATFTGIEEIHLGAGNDSVDAAADGVGSGDDTVLGGTGDDTILGQGDNDSIDGGAGNDELDGDAGNDTVLGGAGNDTLIGDLGNDSVDGGIGDDILFGNEGADTLTGGEGADQLFGGADADVLNVGSNDTAYGQDGDDVFNLSPADLNGGDLTIVGGELDETVGDTLNIQGPAEIVYDVPGGESGTIHLLRHRRSRHNINYVPCFTPGTLIKTRLGAVAVEDLETGDRVLTRDNGYRAIRWAGKRHLSASDIAQKPSLAPILIRAGALGPNLPEVDMMVSPQHRVLISTLNTQLLFGEDEVLIMAHDLLTLDGVEQAIPDDGVTYVHFMFDSHELVLSDGIWTESYQPGDLSLGSMDHERREEIYAIFPELKMHSTTKQFQAARLSLKSYQAQVVLQLP